jgi:hypothetical protein
MSDSLQTELDEISSNSNNQLAMAVVVAIFASGSYIFLSGILTLHMKFWHITSNWIILVLLLGGLLIALTPTKDRLTAVLSALLVPMTIIFVAFGIGQAPYIRQNLGLSHFFGRMIIVIVPGLISGFIAALLSKKP